MIGARHEEGSALIELCLLAPLVFVVFLAATDLCFYVQRSLIVTDAASAGARFGTVAGNWYNAAGMQAAAVNASNGLNGFTATASNFCTCSPGGSTVDCVTGTCGSSQPQPSHYVEVVTNATVPVMFDVSSIPASMNISSTSILRVPWTGQ